MTFNTPGGTTIQDMHDLLDTVEGRTTFSVKDYGAIGTDVQANAATDTAAFLAATAAAAATPPDSTSIALKSWSPSQSCLRAGNKTSLIELASPGHLGSRSAPRRHPP